ncbi:hypothetical protein MNBD_GAMMA14-359 [hydrothermal vent metagenome]|uniref:Uncharacterized protein n=1 Tax=hydrothermal vent metagenome TaxID=652676 RepID=A0A3B0YA82_9ZZZZ
MLRNLIIVRKEAVTDPSLLVKRSDDREERPRPVADAPAKDEPAKDEPSADEPASEAPVSDVPAAETAPEAGDTDASEAASSTTD